MFFCPQYGISEKLNKREGFDPSAPYVFLYKDILVKVSPLSPRPNLWLILFICMISEGLGFNGWIISDILYNPPVCI